MGLIRVPIAFDDAITYRVSAGPKASLDASAIEDAFKSPEAEAILGVVTSVKATARGSFVDVVVVGGAPLSDEQIAALGKLISKVS